MLTPQRFLVSGAVAAGCIGVATAAHAQGTQDAPERSVPEIVVVESANRTSRNDITPGESAAPVPDAMEVLTRLPGANVNRNGPLSGQAQYRGLFGPRMTVTVNDMRVTPGGPNWMDAPLHYMPAGLTERVTMTRGIAPVSAGPGIGGLIEAEAKGSEFTATADWRVDGNAVVSLMSNEGTAASAVVALANHSHRMHAIASDEEGDAIESATGVIGATSHERATRGLAYGYRWDDGEVGIEYSHTDTGSTGTPSLPLDINLFDTERVNAELHTRLRGADVTLRVFSTDILHAMDNYTLRDTPDFSSLPLPPFAGDDRRFVDVAADAVGFIADATLDAAGGRLSVGVDGNSETHSAVVLDPDFAPFFVENFNDAEQDFVGAFAEWYGDLNARWSMELGARYSRVESDAGPVDAFPAQLADMNPAMFGPGTPPFAVRMLRERFNAGSRAVTDDNVDVVAKLDYRLDTDLTLGFGYGRKTRSPIYIERYLWIPLEVNSGLGDLNNYVGNVNLSPESSDQLELSLDWSFENGYLAPRLFYRSVDDYIQGVASTDPLVVAVSANANGDPTPLEFANVDAELYGFDLVGRYAFSETLRLDATVNFVRGNRTDVDDVLYRIAPPNARLSLTADLGAWSLTVESVLVAEQDRISRALVLDEPRSVDTATSGYGLLNFYGRWRAADNVSVRFGVENLLDKQYASHLAGFNRVSNSSVPVGARVPGTGINGFGQVQLRW